MDILDFLPGDIHKGMVASGTTTLGCVSPGMSSHAQTCLDLLRVPLGSPGSIVRLKVI